MAKFKVTCTKSAPGAKRATAPAKKLAAGAPTPDILIDNQDQAFTVTGVDSQGAPVDISSTFTLTCVSDATNLFTVDPASGMTVQGHAVLPGTANLTFTATANDGSATLTFVLPITITAGPAGGLVVTPGTPTTR